MNLTWRGVCTGTRRFAGFERVPFGGAELDGYRTLFAADLLRPDAIERVVRAGTWRFQGGAASKLTLCDMPDGECWGLGARH